MHVCRRLKTVCYMQHMCSCSWDKQITRKPLTYVCISSSSSSSTSTSTSTSTSLTTSSSSSTAVASTGYYSDNYSC